MTRSQIISLISLFAAVAGIITIYIGTDRADPTQPVIITRDSQGVEVSRDKREIARAPETIVVGKVRKKSKNRRTLDSERAKFGRRLNQLSSIHGPEDRRSKLRELALFAVDSNRIDLALEALRNIADTNELRIFLDTVLEELVAQDPNEAIVWLNDFAANWETVGQSNFVDVLTPVIVELSEVDTDLAYDLIDNQGDEKIRDTFLTRITHSLLNSDIRKALDWVDRFPEGPHRDKTLFKIGFQWSQRNTEAAAEWIVSLPEDEGKDKAIEGLVNIWIAKDPRAAANWAIQLSDPYTREIAVANVVNTWTYRDPRLVSEWVVTFPPSELRRESFAQTVGIWAQFDPESAQKWLNSIDDQKLRTMGLNLINANH